MILEAAYLLVKKGLEEQFERDFAIASQYIASIAGYSGHTLHRCMEQPNKYLLLVNWKTLEDHTIGFRESEVYQKWKVLLHHYYEPFPIVEHFTMVSALPMKLQE